MARGAKEAKFRVVYRYCLNLNLVDSTAAISLLGGLFDWFLPGSYSTCNDPPFHVYRFPEQDKAIGASVGLKVCSKWRGT